MPERSSGLPMSVRFRAVARRGTLLPAVAIVVAVLVPLATFAVAGTTLGYDFRAYYAAGARVLAGQPVYDSSSTVAGPYGLFLYPPTFLPLILPLAQLPLDVATWVWLGLMTAATAGAIALMPVSRQARWLVLLLGAQCWPVVYALKLGQVGPLLLLLFVLGWRALDRPARFGAVGALGAAIKIQPGLLLVWAVLTRRRAALVSGVAVLVVLGLLGTALTGIDGWVAFLTVIGRISDPIATPHNFTPGAVSFGLGASREIAVAIQWGTTAGVVALVLWSALRLPAIPSYLVAVVATQLLSPVLWDHYAIVLLVPVAWLVERGCRWAVLVPLATSVLLVGWMPPLVYPLVYAVTLAALVMTGLGMTGQPWSSSRLRPA